MESITLQAYAKINLGLDVIRKRRDGYHEVKMIMQNISLSDTLDLGKPPDRRLSCVRQPERMYRRCR